MSDLTPAVLADLRAKAEAATDWSGGEVTMGDYGWVVTDWPGGGPRYDEDSAQGRADAEHILAASSATVLALVAEVERLRGAERAHQKLIDALGFGDESIRAAVRARFGRGMGAKSDPGGGPAQ